ncbi:MAG: diacylglycerol kinase [Ruaniaceae bacterium]|nr:diacylglycerol kinase [Ruaniaceae bacterium]
MPESLVYVLIALLVIGGAAVAFLWRQERPTTAGPEDPAAATRAPFALIYNPSKPHDWPAILAQVTDCARAAGFDAPLVFETTPEDPGNGQAARALLAGASVVIAAGGDGTVRAVAGALAGTGVPMAIIPSGTGNLFARNIDLPLDDPAAAISIALGGTERAIDIGWLQDTDAAHDPREHPFLVVAGIGFDGEMVAETDDDLKAAIGWFAYGVGAVKGMLVPRMEVSVEIDGAPRAVTGKARTVMIANCGWLPAGFALQPDAEVDDGWLDLVTVDTRGGILGWASVGSKLLLRTFGYRGAESEVASTLEYHRGRSFRISTGYESWVQVDGDLVSETTQIAARIDPGALLVRVPPPESLSS